MSPLTLVNSADDPFEMPSIKMVVAPKTYSMRIPEFCEQLALAIHPVIDGELSIEEALKVKQVDGLHFSEVAVDTIHNAALRRASTGSVCSSALYTAVFEQRLGFIHPMTRGTFFIVVQEVRDEKDMDSSCKSPWQLEADKHQVRLSDLVPFAKIHHVELAWADLDNPMPRTRTRRTKTEERYQAWLDKACQLQEISTKHISVSELARRVSSAFSSDSKLSAAVSTIYNQISLHQDQIYRRF